MWDDLIQSQTRLYYKEKMEYERVELALAGGTAVTSKSTLPLLQSMIDQLDRNICNLLRVGKVNFVYKSWKFAGSGCAA